MANDNYVLTQEGKEKLEEELHYLETEKRAEIGERIKVDNLVIVGGLLDLFLAGAHAIAQVLHRLAEGAAEFGQVLRQRSASRGTAIGVCSSRRA